MPPFLYKPPLLDRGTLACVKEKTVTGMKVVGGSFGTSGSAFISKGRLFVKAAGNKHQFTPEQIESMDSRIDTQKEFGCLGAIIGSLVLGFIGMFIFGPFGAIAGIVIACVAAKKKTEDNIATINFHDGRSVVLNCTPRGIKQLFRLKN